MTSITHREINLVNLRLFREIVTTLKREIESKLKPDDIYESLCKLYNKGTMTEIECEKL